MNKGTITLVVFAVLFLFGGIYACNKRNTFMMLKEEAKSQWQQVENQYQRRLDLIPNLVKTVEAEANFEKSTLTQVIEARAKATQVKINPENFSEQDMQKYRQVQGELSSALSRLLVVAENYPNLKSNQAFADLRVALEGCENRISTERMRFNEKVKNFNVEIKKIPGSLFAWGYTDMPYFEAEAGAEKAPKVDIEIK
ncbi:MAG: LemA family protein [Bacteroidia bacterium]|nr:LemA family protein [Bacteroidia bacterium]